MGCRPRHKNVEDLLHGVLLNLTIQDVCVRVTRIADLSVPDDGIVVAIKIEILLGRDKDLLIDTIASFSCSADKAQRSTCNSTTSPSKTLDFETTASSLERVRHHLSFKISFLVISFRQLVVEIRLVVGL